MSKVCLREFGVNVLPGYLRSGVILTGVRDLGTIQNWGLKDWDASRCGDGVFAM